MRPRTEGRVVLLGATGYVGRLTAAAMVRLGLVPVLAGRSTDALQALAAQLQEQVPQGQTVETAVADVTRPTQVRELLSGPDDVLVTTVGPFGTLGQAALAAAAEVGAAYLDCNLEPAFVRTAFEKYGPLAEQSGAVLLPGFGADYVSGCLAATIAVRRTLAISRPPARVDIGYFTVGSNKPSSGMRASTADVLFEDAHRYVGRRIRRERPAARSRGFEINGRNLDGMSLGGTEPYVVPRLSGTIAEVNVYHGLFGRMGRAAAMAGALNTTASRVPVMGSVWSTVVRGVGVPGASGGPTDDERGRARSVAVAETFDAEGDFQHRVRVEGPSPYDLTASLLAWGAGMVVQGALSGSGALGPMEAFGVDALFGGTLAMGLSEVHYR
jgi:short subunit dehydrogenase-like uncharacterized protein